MTGIKEASNEIGGGIFLGLATLGFFLMLGLCSTGGNKPITKTDFQYCHQKTNKEKEECFQKLKELNK